MKQTKNQKVIGGGIKSLDGRKHLIRRKFSRQKTPNLKEKMMENKRKEFWGFKIQFIIRVLKFKVNYANHFHYHLMLDFHCLFYLIIRLKSDDDSVV